MYAPPPPRDPTTVLSEDIKEFHFHIYFFQASASAFPRASRPARSARAGASPHGPLSLTLAQVLCSQQRRSLSGIRSCASEGTGCLLRCLCTASTKVRWARTSSEVTRCGCRKSPLRTSLGTWL